jgi:hypothetical protein
MNSGDAWLPGPQVTKRLFDEWRSPRRGVSNPQNMNNPVWEWLVRTKLGAYFANKHFNGESPFHSGPGWCCNRFGQSSTELPDGRTILVAGEHEDHYDPDFFIYNDVIVLHADGRIDIFGYPEADFPPTDFHSATLVDNQLILIGSLGYPHTRQASETPVFALDVQTLRIERIATTGDNPGWVYDHSAMLDSGEICIRGGNLYDGSIVENIDDWKLNLSTWTWTRLTDRRWFRIEVSRSDKRWTVLSNTRSLRFDVETKWYLSRPEAVRRVESQMNELTELRGAPPDFSALDSLYKPPIEHKPLPENEDELHMFRIQVDGIVVRYVEEHYSVTMTVEGELPQETLDLLAGDLLQKFAEIENAQCVRRVY